MADTAAPARRPWRWGSLRPVLLPLAFAALTLIAWEAVVRFYRLPEMVLPAPSRMFAFLWQHKAFLAQHLGQTTAEAVLGFLLAAVTGTLLAALLSLSRIAREALYPNMVVFQMIPKVALAPLFILYVGIGPEARLSFAVFVAFFPIAIAGLAGFAAADRDLLRLSRSLTATPWQIFRHLQLPSALPFLFAGLKIGITMAVIGIIVGEFVAAERGLGYLILFSASRADTTLALASVFLLCAMGLCLFGLVGLAHSRVLKRLG